MKKRRPSNAQTNKRVAKKKRGGSNNPKGASSSPTLLAQGTGSDLIHAFNLNKDWEKTVRDLSDQYNQKLRQFITETNDLLEFMKMNSLPASAIKQFEGTFYRAVPGKDPLNPLYSRAEGGRFNIGAAQKQKILENNFLPQGAIYCSTSPDAALAEIGLVKDDAKVFMYSLKVKGPLRLWSLEEIISFFKNPLMNRIAESSAMGAAWGYMKVPAASQLFGEILRTTVPMDGDMPLPMHGIHFESTKSKGKFNVCLFIDTKEKAEELVTPVLINESGTLKELVELIAEANVILKREQNNPAS